MSREAVKWVAGLVLVALGLAICNEIGLLVAAAGAGIISE